MSKTVVREERDDSFTVESLELSQHRHEEYNEEDLGGGMDYDHEEEFKLY
jgi:hypothetical protein